ncbi:FunK1 protein kinase [Macrophomina phaseolina]|uniref:non-specific serine/threonine protein kinase n=1 Tax=Macrophomina phaseolina TaxID=35725 RepID=A0ABQ8G2S4_9PEZI|nr:FunK1 protein kinase [Macrophomina phaseolina]
MDIGGEAAYTNVFEHRPGPRRDGRGSTVCEVGWPPDDSKEGRKKAISRLLSALMGTEVALDLRLKASGLNVVSELALVIHNASDSKIWSAVLDLITTLTRVTPPASVPATFDSTPITHSSASQQGAKQTREAVERKVFEEIRFCTYRDVEGFFEKYFEGKDWTRRALDIYKAMKERHVDGAWTDLPDPPVQAEVLDWWFRFQDEFLSEERRRYYSTTNPKDLIGAEAQRQIDLFRDVEVIGELKASNNNKKATLLQIGRYSTRRYVHAFTICGREMEVWVFDRSECYSPGAFDIHEEPERFIQVIAERDDGGRLIHIEQDGPSGRKRLRLESQPFTRQRAIVCRGTSCYLTKPPESEDWSHVAKFSWTSDRREPEADLLRLARQRGVEGIARLIGRRRITSINEMRSGLIFTKPYSFRGPPSAASSFSQSFSQSQPPSAVSRSFSEPHGPSIADRPSRKRKSVDVGREPSKRSKSNSQRSSQGQNEVTYDVEAQGTSLLAPNNGPYDNRVFRCLVISPTGQAIHKYEKKSELLGALRDAIKAHRSLYLKRNILHRDISENNIIMIDPKRTGVMGMLIDLDLAKELGSGRSGARCRPGTMEFMAIEVLPGISHTYRHDLATCLSGRAAKRMLTDWYTGSYQKIANTKLGHMNKAEDKGFGLILSEFPPEFDCVKPLCRELRGILFPIHKDELFTGTPKDPEILYGPILRAFDKAVDDIRAMEG